MQTPPEFSRSYLEYLSQNYCGVEVGRGNAVRRPTRSVTSMKYDFIYLFIFHSRINEKYNVENSKEL